MSIGQVIQTDEARIRDHLGEMVRGTVEETLTYYYAFPDIHWQKIRTNNPLERIMKEIRRRTRVVGAFPDGQSCLNLAPRDCATSPAQHGLPSAT